MRHLLSAVLVISAGAAAVSPLAAQTDCVQSATPCADAAQSAARNAIQQRLNRTLATSPDGHIQKRLQGNAWDAGANGASPWSIAPSGATMDISTSLSQWGSWRARTDSEAVNAAKSLLEEGEKLPAPAPVTNHSFDMWMHSRVTTPGSEAGQSGEAMTSYVGTDYVPFDGLVMGGLVQFDSMEGTPNALSGQMDNEGYLAGPYMAMQLTPKITFDGKLAWGAARDRVQYGSATDRYDTARQLARAQVKGQWAWQGWQFTPAASAQITREEASSQFQDLEAEAGSRTVSVNPRLSRNLRIDDNKTIEPFVHLNSSLNMDAASDMLQGHGLDPEAQPTSVIGGGLTLSKSDGYSLTATTDFQGVGGPAQPNMNSRLNLSIPLD